MRSPLERFLEYVKVETTSSEESSSTPSTPSQFELAKLLTKELRELGLEDVEVDEHCYVTGFLPSNIKESKGRIPTIGLISHLDTSCAASGSNIKAKVITYEGGDIALQNGAVIKETDEMKKLIGDRFVVTDGTTLLGADDKAGIAAIITCLERLASSSVPRPNVRVCFTPDEEIGNGTAFFNLENFKADCAYTVDGGPGGEINYETFTADKAVLVVHGVDVHPGEAKGVMVNAARILGKILAKLPSDRAPETTEAREPFIHLYKCHGGVTSAQAEFLLRAFDEEAREKNKQILLKVVEDVFNEDRLLEKPQVSFEQQYLNMGYFLKDCPYVLSTLEEAARRSGLVPRWIPIRGGTDGSRLTEMGLPTPNIFTGGRNFHSVMEFLDVEELEKSAEVLLHLMELWGEKRFGSDGKLI